MNGMFSFEVRNYDRETSFPSLSTMDRRAFENSCRGNDRRSTADVDKHSRIASVASPIGFGMKSCSDASAVNTVKVKDKKIGGAVPSLVKPKK